MFGSFIGFSKVSRGRRTETELPFSVRISAYLVLFAIGFLLSVVTTELGIT